MTRLTRLPLHVRGAVALLSLTLLLWSGIPVLLFPFAALDASHYRTAIVTPAARCAGDPVPAPGGCWSSAAARVTITGSDHLDSGEVVDYAVVEVPGRDPVREDLVSAAGFELLGVGQPVSVRYWGSAIADIVPPTAAHAAPLLLATRDNPSYRTRAFPVSDAMALVLALCGVVLFGVPLLGDAQRWRRRRRIEEEAEAAARDALSSRGFGRGLARYGMEPVAVPAAAPAAVPEEPEAPHVVLSGEREQPRGTVPGGAGWNIRTH
jgi:hypothetical protein